MSFLQRQLAFDFYQGIHYASYSCMLILLRL